MEEATSTKPPSKRKKAQEKIVLTPESTKPMKHRLRQTSFKELYDIVQCKQNQFAPKYLKHCKQYGIVYPKVNERERDHLNTCHSCQKIWPMYLFEQHYINKRPVDEVAESWLNLTESERVELLPKLVKADQKWLRDVMKTRSSSSFQIYVREKIDEDAAKYSRNGISERSTMFSKMWKSEPDEVKFRYKQLALKAKVDRTNELASLPTFKKKQVARARAESKRAFRECHPTRPMHAYLLFQQDEWKMEKLKANPMPYVEFIKQSAERWKLVSEERRQTYESRVEKQREVYFQKRNEMIKVFRDFKKKKPQIKETETDDEKE